MGSIKIKYFAILLFCISNTFSFDWNSIERTICIDQQNQNTFSEASIDVELNRAKQDPKSENKAIYYRNAIEFARLNPRDLYCLSRFFKLEKQQNNFQITSNLLYERFLLEGGLHSSKLNSSFSTPAYPDIFLYSPSLIQMAKYNYRSLQNLLVLSSKQFSIFIYTISLLLFSFLFFNYANKISLWTYWGFSKMPTGALSFSILFLIFSLVVFLDLRIACLILIFFFKPLFFKKQKIIAALMFIFLAIANLLFSIGHPSSNSSLEDSPSQLNKAIWDASPQYIPNLTGPLTKAIIFYKSSLFNESLEELEKLEYLNPLDFRYYAVESAVQFKLKNYDVALSLQKKAFQFGLDPDVFYYNLNHIYNTQRSSSESSSNSHASLIANLHDNFLSRLSPYSKNLFSQELLLPFPKLQENLSELVINKKNTSSILINLFYIVIALIVLFFQWQDYIKSKTKSLYRSELRTHLIHYRTRKAKSFAFLSLFSTAKNPQSIMYLFFKLFTISLLFTLTIPVSFLDYRINIAALSCLLSIVFFKIKPKKI